MQLRRALGALCAALAVAVPAAGCGGGGSADAVGFTDKVCVAFIPFVEVVSKAPPSDDTDPVAASQARSDYLGAAAAAAEKAIADLDAVGTSSLAGGNDLVTRLKTAFTQVKAVFAEAKAQLDSAPDTPQGKAEAINASGATLASLSSLPNPTTDLENNAELNAAAENAPNCQRMKNLLQ